MQRDGTPKNFPANDVKYDELFCSPHSVPVLPLDPSSLSSFFFYSVALSSWKSSGRSCWSLRVHPSSGALCGMETYVIIGNGELTKHIDEAPDIGACLFHYNVRSHNLELRASFSLPFWTHLTHIFPEEALSSVMFVAVCSCYWRESWKYGERGFRYCLLDTGHVIGSITLSASLHGWSAMFLPNIPTELLASFVGTSRQEDFPGPQEEGETPDCLIAIYPNTLNEHINITEFALDEDFVASEMKNTTWYGKANTLSCGYDHYPVIYQTDDVTALKTSDLNGFDLLFQSENVEIPKEILEKPSTWQKSAGELFRKRRSAHKFKQNRSITSQQFFKMMAKTMPSLNPLLWGSFPFVPRTHILLFVHQVEGLAAGVYILIRNKNSLSQVQEGMAKRHKDFQWQSVENCPPELPLYFLTTMPLSISNLISCEQKIACTGVFSAAFISELGLVVKKGGSWHYRRLHYEAGLIGHSLYLEAESEGLQGTGMGCFYDEPTAKLIGVPEEKKHTLASLYHFTVGYAKKDSRIQSMSSYPPPIPLKKVVEYPDNPIFSLSDFSKNYCLLS